jgi:surface protein
MSFEKDLDWEIVYKAIFHEKKLRIFGENFVKKNKDKCKIIYKDREYQLKEYLFLWEIDHEDINNEIKIIIKGINKFSDMADMFYHCSNLLKISEKRNDNNPQLNFESEDKSSENNNQPNILDGQQINSNIDKNSMFNELNKITSSLSSISKDNNSDPISTSNISSIRDSLLSPIIINITEMTRMFSGCNSLISLPNLKNWNVSNVTNMNDIFYGCASLVSLPDITGWDLSNAVDMSNMFLDCKSLKSLPDISKWKTSNILDMFYLFHGCHSLISLPDISKWDTSKVTNMSGIFGGCKSLKTLPDISKWDTSNVYNMVGMFDLCKSLKSLPDI